MRAGIILLLLLFLTACEPGVQEFVCGQGECHVKKGDSFRLFSYKSGFFASFFPYPANYDKSILEVDATMSSPGTIYMKPKAPGQTAVQIFFGPPVCLQDPQSGDCKKHKENILQAGQEYYPYHFAIGADDRGIERYGDSINVFVSE